MKLGGQIFMMYFSLQPFRDENGTVSLLLASASDVTERARIESELRKTKDRLNEAVSAGKVGLWYRDLRSDEVYYSPEWKRQLGYENDEIPNDFNELRNRLH